MCNILHRADRRAKLMSHESLGLTALGTPYAEYFSSQIIWFQVGFIRCTAKFLMLIFSKGYCFPTCHSVSTKLYRMHVHIFGGNTACWLFWLAAKNFKSISMTLWRQATSATLPVSIKLCWFHLLKGQADRQGPWTSCWFYVTCFLFVWPSHMCRNDLKLTCSFLLSAQCKSQQLIIIFFVVDCIWIFFVLLYNVVIKFCPCVLTNCFILFLVLLEKKNN